MAPKKICTLHNDCCLFSAFTANVSLMEIYIDSALISTMLDEKAKHSKLTLKLHEIKKKDSAKLKKHIKNGEKKTFRPLPNHMMKINSRFGNIRVEKWHLYVDCLQFIKCRQAILIILFNWSTWRWMSSIFTNFINFNRIWCCQFGWQLIITGHGMKNENFKCKLQTHWKFN